MKQWYREGEYGRHGNCDGDIRFIRPPEHLTPQDREEVEALCWSCPVRAECIGDVVKHRSVGVWCASRFLPEPFIDDSKSVACEKLAEAERIRAELASTVGAELERRGDF